MARKERSYRFLFPKVSFRLKKEIKNSNGVVDIIVHPRFAETEAEPGKTHLDIMGRGEGTNRSYDKYLESLVQVLKKPRPKFVFVCPEEKKRIKKWIRTVSPNASVVYVTTPKDFPIAFRDVPAGKGLTLHDLEWDNDPSRHEPFTRRLHELGVSKTILHGEMAVLLHPNDFPPELIGIYEKYPNFKKHLKEAKEPFPIEACVGNLYRELIETGKNLEVVPGIMFPGVLLTKKSYMAFMRLLLGK